MTARLDHLVLGVPDFAAGLEHVARLTGVTPTAGGAHPGQGTRNAVLRLGPKRYLEVLGPDPEQTPAHHGLRFDLDKLKAPSLVAWCLRVGDLEEHVERARQLGMAPTGVVPLSRQTPAGEVLRWRVAGLGLGSRGRGLGGTVPFLIDWGDTSHPADGTPDAVSLREFSLRHPDPDRVHRLLSSLGIRVSVLPADAPGLVATLETPRGTVTML